MWEVTNIDIRDTAILNASLAAGWEPFAVSTRKEPWHSEILWLRRKK